MARFNLGRTVLVASIAWMAARHVTAINEWEYEFYPEEMTPQLEADVIKAIDCIQENYCSRVPNSVTPINMNIKCQVNDAIAYMCNYGEWGNPCDRGEMFDAWGHGDRKFLAAYRDSWKKTYGFAKSKGGLHADDNWMCGNTWRRWDFDMSATAASSSSSIDLIHGIQSRGINGSGILLGLGALSLEILGLRIFSFAITVDLAIFGFIIHGQLYNDHGCAA
ncbi:hypothetical protein GQ53DRAFT_819087 [Thozetella sp. PMI_491]|nr:hypothetical protein GQ53DRAFT_819087 [Thozetella sp. PMI_491]